MGQLERRLGDEDIGVDLNRRSSLFAQIANVHSHNRNLSHDDNADDNRNVLHDSLHASVQLPVPIIPNLSRGGDNYVEEDQEEPQIVEVEDQDVMPSRQNKNYHSEIRVRSPINNPLDQNENNALR